jgi:riboflavin kinase/FMN adenylyltransferase
MEVIEKDREWKRPFKNPVLTIGNFDGVHLGHQKIFQRVVQKAKEIEGESVVYTFDPHPVAILAPDRQPPLLTPLKEKLRLIGAQGIDFAIVASFTRDYARQSPEDFVRGTLYHQIQIRHLYVGHDFAFGRGGKGDIALLKELGRKYGFNVEVIDAVRLEGRVVSSSLIRDLLQRGEVKEAGKFLGRNYQIVGKVIHGHGRGSRKLGFPTANLRIEEMGVLIPKPGIYAVFPYVGEKRYWGVANLGWNPTFQDQKFSIEVHILNFHQEIYGQRVKMEFVERMRDEVTFRGAEDLAEQIKRDIQQARKILKSVS